MWSFCRHSWILQIVWVCLVREVKQNRYANYWPCLLSKSNMCLVDIFQLLYALQVSKWTSPNMLWFGDKPRRKLTCNGPILKHGVIAVHRYGQRAISVILPSEEWHEWIVSTSKWEEFQSCTWMRLYSWVKNR